MPREGKFFCTKCGGPGIPDESQPAIDDRWAIGRCTHCSPPGKKTKKQRPVDQLMHESAWDPAKFEAEKEKAEMRRLVASALDYIHPPKQMARMVELVDKYGMDGFTVTAGMRAIADSYEPSGRDKRGRGA